MSAQKGRDAVRPPQTHLETRSAAITRPKRRPRRIPPRRHRPKPPQARHADPNANADLSNLRRRAAHEHGRDRRSPPPQYFKTDFFNGIGQTRKLPLANMGYRLAPIAALPRRRLTWPVSTRRVLVHLPHAAPLGCHPGLIAFISLMIRFQRTSIGSPSQASQRGRDHHLLLLAFARLFVGQT